MHPTLQTSSGHSFDQATIYDRQTREFRVLLVSANLESRRAVSRILEELGVIVIPCSSLEQAEQALSLQRPHLVFCEERLPDGDYSNLLEMKSPEGTQPLVVVLTRNGEWELYMDATRRGAFDVIRSPWCPTDIELSVIRAAREKKYKTADASD